MTSYYKQNRSGLRKTEIFHQDIMPGTVRLLVQLQQPAPHGRKPEYSQQELRSCRIISSIWQAGKTARFPAEGGSAKGGMGSALTGLYGVLIESIS